jgi:hypothetical protein
MSVFGQNDIYIASGIQENASIAFNVGFVESQDGGSTFSKQIIPSNQTWSIDPYDEPPHPSIASDGANVYVAWRYPASDDNQNHETFLAASYDAGKSFTRQLNISASKGGDTIRQPLVVAAQVDRVLIFWPEQVIHGNSSNIDLLLVKGQIPEEYTQPFRQVSYMTPVEPTNPTLVVAAITALVVGIGATSTILILRRRRNIK